jgi:broad specificity phosphatase PhoE
MYLSKYKKYKNKYIELKEKILDMKTINHDTFFNTIIEDNSLSIEGVETYEELFNRAEYLIEYLKNSDTKKILVVTHSGFLEIMLKILFNLSVLPQGNLTNGKNCSICYCTLKNNIFTMVSPQNTEHLSINLD